MTPRFQACVGPGMRKVHIRDTSAFGPYNLALCRTTTSVRDYKAALFPDNLCHRCMVEMALQLGFQIVLDKSVWKNADGAELIWTPELIGVSKFT